MFGWKKPKTEETIGIKTTLSWEDLRKELEAENLLPVSTPTPATIVQPVKEEELPDWDTLREQLIAEGLLPPEKEIVPEEKEPLPSWDTLREELKSEGLLPPSISELKPLEVAPEYKELVTEAEKPIEFKWENVPKAMQEEIKQTKESVTKVTHAAGTVGSFVGNALMSGVSDTNTFMLNILKGITQGYIAATDKLEDLFGQPESYFDPKKQQILESMVGLIETQENYADIYWENATKNIEELEPRTRFIVEAVGGAVRAVPLVITSAILGGGTAGIGKVISPEFARMIPFGVLTTGGYARDIEKEFEARGIDKDWGKIWVGGAALGLAEMATESVAFQQFFKTAKVEGVTNVLKNLFIGLSEEATQEAIMEPVEMGTKETLGLPQDWSLESLIPRMGQAGLSGAFLGLLMGGSLYGTEQTRQNIVDTMQKLANEEIDTVTAVNEITNAVSKDTQVKETLQQQITPEMIKPEGVTPPKEVIKPPEEVVKPEEIIKPKEIVKPEEIIKPEEVVKPEEIVKPPEEITEEITKPEEVVKPPEAVEEEAVPKGIAKEEVEEKVVTPEEKVIPKELEPLAEEAIKYESPEEFSKLLTTTEGRTLSGQEKAILITGKPIKEDTMTDEGIQALREKGIPIRRDFTGGVDVIALDEQLTYYLQHHPNIITNFYESAVRQREQAVVGREELSEEERQYIEEFDKEIAAEMEENRKQISRAILDLGGVNDPTYEDIPLHLKRKTGYTLDYIAGELRGVYGYPVFTAEDVYDLITQSRPKRFVSTEASMKLSAQPITQEQVSKMDIYNYIEKEFDVPVRGRATTKMGKAAGSYFTHSDLIRLKSWGDLPALAHELGHKIYPSVSFSAEASAELAKLDYEPQKARVDEGFSEYIRVRLSQGVREAQQLAPKAHAEFETILARNPEMLKRFSGLERLYEAYRNQGAINRVLNHIDYKGKYKKKRKPGDGWRWFSQQFLQWFYLTSNLVKEAEAITGTKIPILKNPVMLAKYYRNWSTSWARKCVLEEFVDEYGRPIGKSLKEILEPISPDELQTWLAYVVSLRAQNLEKRGINTGLYAEDVEYFVKTFDNPTWKKAAEEFTEWSNRPLDLLAKYGGLSQEAVKIIKDNNPIYITFKRILDSENIRAVGRGKRFADLPQTPKRIVGSGRMLENVLEATVDHLSYALTRVGKLAVTKSIMELQEEVPGLGKWIVEVPPPTRSFTFKAEQIKDQLTDILGEGTSEKVEIPKEVYDEVLTIFTQSPVYTGKDNIVMFWRDGKRRFFEVDPELYTELRGLEPYVAGNFLKFARIFVDLVRFGAIQFNTAFFSRNLIRDTGTFLVRSKAKYPQIYDTVMGIVQGATAKKEAPEWRAKGILKYSTSSGLFLSATQSLINELINEKSGLKGKLRAFVFNPATFIENLTAAGELGPRMREFYKVYNEKIKEGKTEPEAYVEAVVAGKEVTVDFSEGGPLAKALNMLIPFFSANIQGTRQTLISLKEYPIRTLTRGIGYLTIFSLLLWWENKDKEWWKNLRPEYKYNNLYFEIDENQILRIPIPWEIGFIFSGLPTATMDYLFDNDPDAARGIFTGIKNIMPEFNIALLSPIFDVLRNQSWSGVPIESAAMQWEYPTERKKETTTQIASNLSKILDDMGAKVSPVQLDYLLDQWTGGLWRRMGKYFETFFTEEGRKNMAQAPEEFLPVYNSFWLRTPYYPANAMDKYYDDLIELRQKKVSGVASKEELKILNRIEPYSDKIKELTLKKDKYEQMGMRNEMMEIDKKLGQMLEKLGYR